MDSDTDQDLPNQVLPIGTLKEGAVPQDGMQYLSLVVSEATHLPDVVSVDRSIFTTNTESNDELKTKTSIISKSLIQSQVHKFSKLRQYCARMIALYPKNISNNRLKCNADTISSAPQLKDMLGLPQSLLAEYLTFIHGRWSCGKTDLPLAAKWVFSILCVVDKPVPRDYMSIIRSIARDCIAQCTDLVTLLESQPNDHSLVTNHHSEMEYLVLFIIIANYFEQIDLLEELN